MHSDKPDSTAQPELEDDATPGEDTPEAGTPAGDGPVREEGEGTDYKALHHANQKTLAAKDKALEELRAEIDEIRREQMRSGSQPAAENDRAAVIDEREAIKEQLRRVAAVDIVARAQLLEMERADAREQETADAFALSRLPVADQAAMAAYYDKNRRHFPGGMAEAIRYVRGRQAEATVEKLTAKLAELEKKKPGAEPLDDGEKPVRTSIRDVNRTSYKTQTMTYADFDSKIEEMEGAGDFAGARALRQRAFKKEIILKK